MPEVPGDTGDKHTGVYQKELLRHAGAPCSLCCSLSVISLSVYKSACFSLFSSSCHLRQINMSPRFPPKLQPVNTFLMKQHIKQQRSEKQEAVGFGRRQFPGCGVLRFSVCTERRDYFSLKVTKKLFTSISKRKVKRICTVEGEN